MSNLVKNNLTNSFLFVYSIYILIFHFFFTRVLLMHIIKITIFIVIYSIALTGCSVFGEVSVDVSPYETIEKNDTFEVRRYERLVFASTHMSKGLGSSYVPFRKLFDYISGNNKKIEKIAMTAPVFLEQADQTTEKMSFVLPENFSLPMTPLPNDSSVKISELRNFTVAVISFSGFLNQSSISTHRAKLQNWILERGFKTIGKPKAAGYNPPFTLPFLRRNEVLIPIEKN